MGSAEIPQRSNLLIFEPNSIAYPAIDPHPFDMLHSASGWREIECSSII
jgi:hypothetical protein